MRKALCVVVLILTGLLTHGQNPMIPKNHITEFIGTLLPIEHVAFTRVDTVRIIADKHLEIIYYDNKGYKRREDQYINDVPKSMSNYDTIGRKHGLQLWWHFEGYIEEINLCQQGKCINFRLDKSGNIWEYYGNEAFYQKGICSVYWSNGLLKNTTIVGPTCDTMYCYYEEGMLEGKGPSTSNFGHIGYWQYFHKNGKLRYEGTYGQGTTNVVEVDRYGKSVPRCYGQSNEKNGIWKLYHENGKLWKEEHYEHNVLLKQLIYEDDGEVRIEVFDRGK
jgi:antitoxin component YwqK of YwqJK toxin-antitoxin module